MKHNQAKTEAPRVLVDTQGSVTTVTLNRPEKHNALDMAMLESLIAAGEQLITSSARAVIITGRGKGFCSGLDFPSVTRDSTNLPRLLKREEGELTNMAQQVCWVWRQLPMPVIAALHGTVYGGGLQIALGADLRIASPETRLSVMEIKWGLVPDMTISQTLRELVRMDVAKELTYTGRIIDGKQAAALGLLTRLDADPLGAAEKLAEEICARSPDGVRAAKQLFQTTWYTDTETGLKLETELQQKLLGSPNQMEAMMANFQKRPANFRDPVSKDSRQTDTALQS